MEKVKSILVIHASDADQHHGTLVKILDSLKTENRITEHKSLDSKVVNEHSFAEIGKEDMVMLLLTNGITEDKLIIEEWLLNLKKQQPGSKIAEVIIDNVPYEPSFFALPESLEPIRSSEDMDGVWKGIEENLKKLFPKPEVVPPKPPPPVPPPAPPVKKSAWKKFLPYVFGVLALLAIFFTLLKCFDKPIPPPPKVISVSASTSSPASFEGDCPHKFILNGTIRTNGRLLVKYVWIKKDGTPEGSARTLRFTEAGSKQVRTSWEIGSAGQNFQDYLQLKILGPNNTMVSNKAEIKLNCKRPPTRTGGTFSVRQTYFGDFDLRREVSGGTSRDFQFVARTATNRAIMVQNNAKLSFMNVTSVPTFEQVKSAIRTRSRSEINVNSLVPGRWMGFRTNKGNYVTFTVTQAIGSSPGRMRLRYYYWKE